MHLEYMANQKYIRPTLRLDLLCLLSTPYDLHAFLANISSPLTGKSDYTVNNSSHFVSTINNERVQENEIMVPFDVESLFSNSPIDGAEQAALRRLQSDSSS